MRKNIILLTVILIASTLAIPSHQHLQSSFMGIWNMINDDLGTEETNLDSQYNLKSSNVLGAHQNNILGKGVKIAILDTGCDPDCWEVDGQIIGGYNVIADNDEYDDDNGHGTFLSVLVAGEINDIGIIGFAPEAQLYIVKMLDENGEGEIDDLVKALKHVREIGDIDIILMSFGTSEKLGSQAESEIKACYDAGIIMIAASGNVDIGAGTGSASEYPGLYREVISVGSVGITGYIMGYSNFADFYSYGGSLEAPIVSIGLDNKLSWSRGTSIAAANVAGVVALFISQYGHLSQRDMLLMLTANVWNHLGNNIVQFGSRIISPGSDYLLVVIPIATVILIAVIYTKRRSIPRLRGR